MKWVTLTCLAVAVFGSMNVRNSNADDTDFSLNPHAKPVGYFNLRTWTQGGKQFWTDVIHFHDWRIQQNAFTQHCRLIDKKGVRHAWGNYSFCLQKLNEYKEQQKLQPQRGRAVVLLHGLGRSRTSMEKLAKKLRAETDFVVYNFEYASTRDEVAAHAKALNNMLANLEGVSEINFVGHSLGNIVIRHLLADQIQNSNNRQIDPRFKRIVMLGPPNNGAQLARRFKELGLFHLVWGHSGKQLSLGWEELEKRLATPPIEFGIIAGGGAGKGATNPLVTGDDDLVVSVEETRLSGASDFLLVRAAHTFMMNEKSVMAATLRYLQHGFFVAADRRQPIQ